jgi:hypothetical protein
MLAINTRISPITSSTPASLLLGRECRSVRGLPLDGLQAQPGDAALWESLRRKWEDMHEHVYPAVAKAAAERAADRNARLDASRRLQGPHAPGASVMARDHTRDGTLDARWQGPFTVVERIGQSYKLKDDDGEVLGRLVPHADTKVAQYKKDQGEDVFYTVDSITKHRKRGGRLEYFVRWSHYGADQDSWVKAEHLTPGAIDEYWRDHHGMSQKRGRRRRRRRSQPQTARPTPVCGIGNSNIKPDPEHGSSTTRDEVLKCLRILLLLRSSMTGRRRSCYRGRMK